ncbi:hypothetical protein [Faucicola atlantae]|uniref:Uncharacterized protein n=1 Tax=Faucicola atlantae TaxID=34059 RepID=A0A1B8QKY3_9GAMM|nr:hypothetical protein [Moraxella atlantae]OBX84251.1 hypothetical protein A9306_03690 [Moraxella atlantae]
MSANTRRRLQQLIANCQISDEVNHIANELIKEVNVQSGFGLANFLNVDSKLDNFAAVRAWVNKHYRSLNTDNDDENLNIFKHKFYECLPMTA